MGFNFKQWLSNKLGGKHHKVTEISFTDVGFHVISNWFVRELAFWSCINIVTSLFNKCEFKTYKNNESFKGEEYYLWNVRTNINQSASAFREKLISKLYTDNEVLVVEHRGNLLIADSFDVDEYALYSNQYKNVTVGEITFTNRVFFQEDVLYLKLRSKDMKRLINSLHESYAEMIEYAAKSYKKSRGTRGVLNVDTKAAGNPDFEEHFRKLMEEYFKEFFAKENAVLPLFEGYKFDESNQRTYSNENTRDIKALIDDVFDFTARAILIPPALVKGELQDTSKVIDQLLTIMLDPLAKIVEEEINDTRYGKEEFLKGNRLRIDTSNVKHVDIFDVTTGIEKLISSGSFTINMVLELLGRDKVNKPFADVHFMTKNYATVEELLNSLDNIEID